MAARDAAHRADAAEARNRMARARMQAKALRLMAPRVEAFLSRRKPGHGPTDGATKTAHGTYDSASPRNRLRRTSARPVTGSPNFHLDRHTRDAIRAETQDIERNNPLGRGLISRRVDFAFGDGPTVTFATDDREWNKLANRAVRQWMEGENEVALGRPNLVRGRTYAADVHEVGRAWMVDGDILKVYTVDENGKGCLQWIESQRIVNKGNSWTDSPSMVGGVEIDAVGNAVAYHVASWLHLGTTLSRVTYAVPAEHARLLCNPRFFRAGQVRGEPGMQALPFWFDLLRSYIENTCVAADVATYFGLIVKSKNPAGVQEMIEAGTIDQPDRESSYQPKEVQLGPGRINYCDTDEDIAQVKPEFPTTSFKEFTKVMMQYMGADVGVPNMLSLFDTEGLSYSNLRGLQAIMERGVLPDQAAIIRSTREDVTWKTQEWMRSGVLPYRDDYDAFTVRLPRPPSVDYKTEVEGHILAYQHNLGTKEAATLALGNGSFDEIAITREAETDMEREKGILPAALPGAKPLDSATQPAEKPAPAKPASQAEDEAEQEATP